MKSQLLVIDMIRNWVCGRLAGDDTVTVLEKEYAKLTLVTRDPEYYGNPEFEIRLLCARHIGVDERNANDESIHQLIRSFQHSFGLKFGVSKVEGLTTTVTFKTTDKTQNHLDWNWVEVKAPKPDVI